MSLVLRGYQVRALESARVHYRAGKKSVLIVAPTGAGKTVIMAEAARSHYARKGQVVVLTHRVELIRQTVDKLWKSGVTELGAITAEGGFNERAPVVVCSIQTLLARDLRPAASLLLPDEAHHYLSAEWSKLMVHYQGVPTLGFTATPMRADGTALGNMFEALVVAATNRELVADGHLVPCEVFAPPRRLDKTDLLDPVSTLEKHGGGRQAVIFASSKGHARSILQRLGDQAAYVDGETHPEQRLEALKAFEAGRVRVMVNVFVLTEGWDCPPAEVCVIARGCSSPATFIQMVGRVRRPHPGKTSSLLLDCKGAVYQHGLPDDEREFSLAGRAIRVSEGLPPIRQCPACASVFRTAPTCERCGYEFPPAEAPTEKASEVRRVDFVTPERDRRAFLRSQLRKARELGHKPGWAAHRYKFRFGTWPNPQWLREATP